MARDQTTTGGPKKYRFKCQYCGETRGPQTSYPSSAGCTKTSDKKHVWMIREED